MNRLSKELPGKVVISSHVLLTNLILNELAKNFNVQLTIEPEDEVKLISGEYRMTINVDEPKDGMVGVTMETFGELIKDTYALKGVDILREVAIRGSFIDPDGNLCEASSRSGDTIFMEDTWTGEISPVFILFFYKNYKSLNPVEFQKYKVKEEVELEMPVDEPSEEIKLVVEKSNNVGLNKFECDMNIADTYTVLDSLTGYTAPDTVEAVTEAVIPTVDYGLAEETMMAHHEAIIEVTRNRPAAPPDMHVPDAPPARHDVDGFGNGMNDMTVRTTNLDRAEDAGGDEVDEILAAFEDED